MRLKVRYYGVLTDIAGCQEEELNIPPKSTVTVLENRLIELYPAINTIPVVFFVDAQKGKGTQQLAEGMEIECMPPFSGG